MQLPLNFQAVADRVDAAFSDKKQYALLFVGFFVLEALLSLWMGNAYDMNVWFNTGNWITHGINIYVPPDHLGYPPLWGLWCGASYSIYLLAGANDALWSFIIKLPMILSHLLLALAVVRFAEKRFEQKTSARILFFMLTWSFFFFIGPIWGQINAISLLLTFLAFEAVINKQTSKSAVFLGIAVALKIYPIIALPAFLIYVLKNRNKAETGKLFLITAAIPIVFTAVIFLVFQWDIMYFFRTVFYSTPAFESNPTQITIGCMNVWSYIGLLNVDLAWQWPFRLLWVPLLAVCAVYWFRKDKWDESKFVACLLSFYLVFMASYGWVAEQAFLDLLPFAFLLFLGYYRKPAYLYLLTTLQVLVYIFAVANRNLLVFEPLVWKISVPIGTALHSFYDNNSLLIWTIRGYLGLVISITLLAFLAVLMKPTIMQSTVKLFTKVYNSVLVKLRLKKYRAG